MIEKVEHFVRHGFPLKADQEPACIGKGYFPVAGKIGIRILNEKGMNVIKFMITVLQSFA